MSFLLTVPLIRLLDDIEAGRIQMIVVYKIDRLTRSLADFAKLVEKLETHKCSFVSVTQAFNTSSSMGRLTLNVLLSFAQFEREVTAERIRDKIAASKKKGLWMGGVCPIGYDKDPDPQSRTLIVNKDGAKRVTTLFELYEQYGCLRLVEEGALDLGLRSKRHVYATGREAGGKPFSRGQIYHILRNPIYLGQIRHKDKIWPGLHKAIIDQSLWDRVQEKLTAASQRKRRGASSKSDQEMDKAILTGKLFDETGDRLTPTHTTRRGRRLRYYISNRLISGGKDSSALRLSAPNIEKQVTALIADHMEVQANNYTLTKSSDLHGSNSNRKKVISFIKALRSEGLLQYSKIIRDIHVHPKTIRVRLDVIKTASSLGIKVDKLSDELIEFETAWTFKRRGVENRIIIGDPAPEPDQTLIRNLATAHQWVHEMKTGTPLGEIALKQGVTPAYIRTRSRLAFLSPKIQQSILKGTFSPMFTTNKILQMKTPLDWNHQNSLFGI